MNNDAKDLADLLEQLRIRHTVVFYTIVAFTALGVVGILCLLHPFIGPVPTPP